MRSCLKNHPDIQVSIEQIKVKSCGDDTPVITRVRNIISKPEIEYLKSIGETLGWKQSTIVGQDGVDRPAKDRTSESVFIPKGNTEFVQCIEERLATLAQANKSNLEPLQLTRYKKNAQYRPHHDYFENPRDGIQRTTTIFTYLDAPSSSRCGGATGFPLLKDEKGAQLRIQPSVGDALMWSNRTARGDVNNLTLHAGEQAKCDAHKIGMNAWFRDRPW